MGRGVVHMQQFVPVGTPVEQGSAQSGQDLHKNTAGDCCVAQEFKVDETLVVKKRHQEHLADSSAPDGNLWAILSRAQPH